MLGNPKWFKRRKYTGWGLTPATWQGWVYLVVLLGTVFFVSLLTRSLQIKALYQVVIILSMLLLIVIDTVDIVIKMDKDERETVHEALAERNATWVIVLILAGGIIFQSAVSLLQGNLYIDPFIIAALLGGVITKGISNWYYIDK
jgi:hypothetical protein